MKGFIYIYQKKNFKHSYNNIIKKIDALKGTKHSFIVKENDKIISLLYSNEKNPHEYNFKNSRHISTIGQFVDDEQVVINQLTKLKDSDLIKYVSNLRGAFALAIADYKENSMTFFTHIFRIHNIFY